MLLNPTKIFNRITDITIEDLSKNNIKGLLIDVDNTLSTHGSQTPIDNLDKWIVDIKSHGIKLFILSNARRSRVEPFANKVGLEFVCLGTKPLPRGYLEGKRRMKLKSKNIAIVGDQLFTDVLGGKLSFMKTFLVRPIKLEDKMSFKIRRKLENIYFRFFINQKGE